MRLGQTATVLVELPQTAGVTKLPLSALKQSRVSPRVWLVDRATDGQARSRSRWPVPMATIR